MTSVLVVLGVWLGVAAFVGVILGRGIRFADQKAAHESTGDVSTLTMDVAAALNGVIAPGPRYSWSTRDVTAGPEKPPAGHQAQMRPSAERAPPHQAERD